MKSPRLIFTIFVVYLAQGNSTNQCSASPTAEELERNAIKYRLEHIKQGYLRILVVDDPFQQPMERVFESTFDEKRVRQIQRGRLLGMDKWGAQQTIIVTPKQFMSNLDVVPDPLVSISPTTNLTSTKENARILNFQALGMDIGGLNGLHTANVETLLNRADRSKPLVQTERRGALDTWKIDYDRNHSDQKLAIHFTLWIAPSQGYSVVGMKERMNRNGKLYTWVLDSQLKQYPMGNVWFPSKIVKTFEDDGNLVNRQVITIEEARFGGPIDKTAFTPAGLQLKPGQDLVDSSSGTPWLKVWDGKGITDPTQVPEPPAIKLDRQRWMLWSLAVGLALMAVLYFRRVLRHKRSVSGSGS